MKKDKGYGKIADKVLCRLIDALNAQYPGQSVGISPDDFWFQKGDYTHATWDCAVWGAEIPFPGKGWKISLYSFDTMTQCSKGLSIFKHRGHLPNEFEVVADCDRK